MSTETSELSRPQEPTLLRYNDVPRWLWGDEKSGQVADWLYTTSDKIHFIMFSLRPGAYWRHSNSFKPTYDADEGYYILQGSLTLHNPQTGEVCVAKQGDVLHFRRNTWHYGYNFTTGETLVLEAFAPVPAGISPDELSRSAPPPEKIQDRRYELMQNWPWNTQEASEGETIKVLRPSDWLHIIQGDAPPVRVSLFVSTDRLTMGMFTLLPGSTSDPETHSGDEVAVVIEGRVNIYLPETGSWFELHPRDGFFTPEGVRHSYYNMSDRLATLVFGVAPKYL
ncbi:cupin domain-containing protein [Acidobacteria bacterium AH-259-G07]|nr:cupin domain-containing protein [Acidobacteria bacterium AH-259-G07]